MSSPFPQRMLQEIVDHFVNTRQYRICSRGEGGGVPRLYPPIVHFTVLCLVAKPLIRSEAKGDLVMIQTLLLFKCKLLCYHAN